MINIIGGKFKKTKLQVPLNFVRPTSAVKRNAIFSVLESHALKNTYNLYKNQCFIDLFAGSGSLGLEAISRGAGFSYFFENNSEVVKVLKKNCNKICKEKNYEIILDDIFYSNFSNINIPISAIFLDPPYKINPFQKILNNIKKTIKFNVNTKIVLECHKDTIIKLPLNYKIFNEKTFGKTKLIFLKNI